VIEIDTIVQGDSKDVLKEIESETDSTRGKEPERKPHKETDCLKQERKQEAV